MRWRAFVDFETSFVFDAAKCNLGKVNIKPMRSTEFVCSNKNCKEILPNETTTKERQ